jgi:multidrug resistance efflux pump
VANLASGIFRAEAVASRESYQNDGTILRLSPRWARYAYWLLCAVLVAALLYATFGTVHEYATGPAVVRVDDRVEVTARFDGTVAAVEAHPGQHVVAGDLLVRFYLATETAEFDRINREFELQLVKLLRDSSDQAARQAVTTLRAQRELAQARLDERFVRAGQAGIVSDIRIRPGQRLAPGDIILSIIGEDARFSLVAMMPGSYRPQVHAGQKMRFELGGYRYLYRDVIIDSIGDEVVGPREVDRYLGPELGDTISVKGPVVLVQAHLPSRTFVSDDQSYPYYAGMQGTAEVRVRSQRIIMLLIPALKRLVGG